MLRSIFIYLGPRTPFQNRCSPMCVTSNTRSVTQVIISVLKQFLDLLKEVGVKNMNHRINTQMFDRIALQSCSPIYNVCGPPVGTSNFIDNLDRLGYLLRHPVTWLVANCDELQVSGTLELTCKSYISSK